MLTGYAHYFEVNWVVKTILSLDLIPLGVNHIAKTMYTIQISFSQII